ncbi:PREDICTED: uncharacterized protein LOC108367216 [Rhagoletis zephyria]|uniref:uncharacterized protein LOC108367216 n=1 Tax=Rhagoletis zephyria TaxID=28612 RepID=UPI000811388F|nr:PREDICTED: uncharacterized protein LOC108367216 [Rhagoletis zephyria]
MSENIALQNIVARISNATTKKEFALDIFVEVESVYIDATYTGKLDSLNTLRSTTAFLLFPNNTVLQIIASISIPIADLPPKRKVFWDWGLQMNHVMPYDAASFYNVPIWSTMKRDAENVGSRRVNDNQTFTAWIDALGNRHIFDFTAGELYRSIERLIESYGYHSSCLLQSVCDLAKHPFDVEQQHLIADLITFILTPSWHMGFVVSEDNQRRAYETAEQSGTRRLNCKRLFPACKKNLLQVITYVIFENG